MTGEMTSTLTWLAAGFLMGLASFVGLIARLDRSGESGCFYRLILGLVLILLAAIVLGGFTR
ncbi:MAG TPA: hypothetical protein VJG32_13905 [Anaerolineae bacterium]|nr:hypothetical protein [Anaerolineae bacterium]